jgi:hypothetical protein
MALVAAHEDLQRSLKEEREMLEKTLEAETEEFEKTLQATTKAADRAELMARTKASQNASRLRSEDLMRFQKRTSISHLTAGAIFLATPFLGSSRFVKHMDHLLNRAATQSELNFLGAKSKPLEILLGNFKNMIASLGIPTWCFQASDMLVRMTTQVSAFRKLMDLV